MAKKRIGAIVEAQGLVDQVVAMIHHGGRPEILVQAAIAQALIGLADALLLASPAPNSVTVELEEVD